MLEQWEKQQVLFYDKLKEVVRESVKIYENSTIGEKMLHYANQKGNSFLMNTVAYAASNGELTSSSDLEYIDAKFNDKRLSEIITTIISPYATQFQPDTEHAIYQQYLFLTRWRCLLCALSQYDSSTEWLRLFDSKHFNEAYADKNTYRKILNIDD